MSDLAVMALRQATTARDLLIDLAARNPGTVLPLLERARQDVRQTPEYRLLAEEMISVVTAELARLWAEGHIGERRACIPCEQKNNGLSRGFHCGKCWCCS